MKMHKGYITIVSHVRHIAVVIIGTALLGQSIMVVGTAQAAGNDRIYLTQPPSAVFVGQDTTVELRETSNAEQINAVQANITYPVANLQFVGIDDTGSAFGVSAQKSGNNGLIVVARGNTTPLTGDKLVAKLTFKPITAGSVTIAVEGGTSALVSHATNQNIIDSVGSLTGQIYASQTSPSGPPPTPLNPSPGPSGPSGTQGAVGGRGPTGAAGPPGRAGSSGGGAPYYQNPVTAPASGSAPKVSLTPSPTSINPNPSPIVLPNGSEIDVNGPATLETTPSGDKIVDKVEYSINKKLVHTANDPPFKYSIQSDKLRNGKYVQTVKTYYEDGTSDSEDTDLNVKNSMNVTQIGLQLRHYAWLILLILIAIAGLIWFKFFRNRGGGDDEFGGDYGSDDGFNPDGSLSGPANTSQFTSQGPLPPGPGGQQYGPEYGPQDPALVSFGGNGQDGTPQFPPQYSQFPPQLPMDPALGNPGAPPDFNDPANQPSQQFRSDPNVPMPPDPNQQFPR